MKWNFKINTTLMVVFIMLFSISTVESLSFEQQEDVTITYQDFYDGLSPYGTWIEYPGYGHVWNPNVGGDFRPYLTNGYWDYTNEGWMWNSNYNWGWAPFHYGRWMNDSAYGWLWVPGYEWSPAWVTWGDVDDYYAWAPITPFVNVGISFSSYRPGSIYWNVVGRNHIYDRNINNRALPRTEINNYVNKITIINNYNRTPNHNHYYSRGPEVKDVERYTKQNIRPVAIQNSKRFDQVSRNEKTSRVYRPIVQHEQPRTYRRIATPMVQPNEATSREAQSREAQSREAQSREAQSREATINHAQQEQRVRALPEFRAPQNTFRSGERVQRAPSSRAPSSNRRRN
ncbi:DUF6600 domain-containing protein [Gelidibacter sp.]|uniref:DUF6600 domain-containing protein n=1 Tax=Gelidibacter sp. TaxID=2018083 RepID=UPI0032656506